MPGAPGLVASSHEALTLPCNLIRTRDVAAPSTVRVLLRGWGRGEPPLQFGLYRPWVTRSAAPSSIRSSAPISDIQGSRRSIYGPPRPLVSLKVPSEIDPGAVDRETPGQMRRRSELIGLRKPLARRTPGYFQLPHTNVNGRIHSAHHRSPRLPAETSIRLHRAESLWHPEHGRLQIHSLISSTFILIHYATRTKVRKAHDCSSVALDSITLSEAVPAIMPPSLQPF